MPPLNFPMCKKCDDGNLVPFFASDGRNVYFCTNCRIKFTGYIDEPKLENQQIFLKKALYLSSDDDSNFEKIEGARLIQETDIESSEQLVEEDSIVDPDIVRQDENEINEDESESIELEPESEPDIELESNVVESKTIILEPEYEQLNDEEIEKTSSDDNDNVHISEDLDVELPDQNVDGDVELEEDKVDDEDEQIDETLEKSLEPSNEHDISESIEIEEEEIENQNENSIDIEEMPEESPELQKAEQDEQSSLEEPKEDIPDQSETPEDSSSDGGSVDSSDDDIEPLKENNGEDKLNDLIKEFEDNDNDDIIEEEEEEEDLSERIDNDDTENVNPTNNKNDNIEVYKKLIQKYKNNGTETDQISETDEIED